MASKRQNPLRMIGEQIHAVMPLRPLNSEDQTIHAKVIETFEDVPQVYQEFFRSHSSGRDAFPYTVITPTYDTSGERITGKLICAIDHAFYVLEANEHSLAKICYPIDEINYVEVIHRQSDLRIKIDGVTNLGLPASSIFGCSKTTDSVFTPLFQRIRLRIVSLNDQAPSRHMEKLDRWNDLHSHVMDMARHCLMAGETVIEAILQPEIKGSIFSTDTAFRGTKCPAHTCILTDKELVMIREDIAFGRKDKCGSLCNFIPLGKIASLSKEQKNGKLLLVTIRVTQGEVFEALFERSLENEVDQFLARTQELMPKERWYRRD